MRFAKSIRIENYLGKKPNYGEIANNSMTAESEERQAQMYADAKIKVAKHGLQGATANATPFSGMVGGLSSGIAGGLGAMGKSSGYTNNPGAKISDPTADIQKALGPGVKFGMY